MGSDMGDGTNPDPLYRHRGGDLPAIIVKNPKNQRWSLKEWWLHGDPMRILGKPSVVYEKIQPVGPMVETRHELMNVLRILFDECDAVRTQDNKVMVCLLVFDLLVTPVGLNIISDYPAFKETTRRKLVELIQEGHLDELKDHYQQIFGGRGVF